HPFGGPVGTRSPLIVGTGQSLQVSDQNVGFLSVRSRVQGTGAVEQATADLSGVCHTTIHHGCPLGDPSDPTRGVRVCVTQAEGRVGLGQTRPGTRVLGRGQDRSSRPVESRSRGYSGMERQKAMRALSSPTAASVL